MRNSRLYMCGVAMAFAFSNTAWAQGESNKAPVTWPSVLPDDADVEVVPSVNPGDQIGIACTALTKSNADSDVRVVLTISAEPGQTPPGYKKVLATDEEVGQGAVRVRIPAVPDLADRMVNVNVYVMGVDGAQKSCDAGHVKIVHQRTAGAPGTAG
jgi:hypothetical protein